jgi:hypothetical protein
MPRFRMFHSGHVTTAGRLSPMHTAPAHRAPVHEGTANAQTSVAKLTSGWFLTLSELASTTLTQQTVRVVAE